MNRMRFKKLEINAKILSLHLGFFDIFLKVFDHKSLKNYSLT
jgi:hypothetical protein